MVVWGGCGQLNRFLIATSQRLLSYPGLDELPILLLSSDCNFGPFISHATRVPPERKTTTLCPCCSRFAVRSVAPPTRRRLQVVQIVIGRDQPLLKLRPGEQR